MNETFKKLNVQERRAAEEKEFTAWVNADKNRIEKYGSALETINKAIEDRAGVLYLFRYFSENSFQI